MMLKRNILGQTGLTVTEFCLGVLPMGPLQADLPAGKCISIISRAIELGVNFIDTAEMYHTQTYIGEAIKGKRDSLVIASKSTKSDYDGMAESVERSLNELQTDYIDIYNLHAARISDEVFNNRSGALKRLTELKNQNIIKAVGLATHNVKAVSASAERDDIDVVFPLLNFKGMGVLDGTVDEMLSAIKKVHASGKGVYLMKALGGGNLLSEFGHALNWARAIKEVSALAIGAVEEEEVEINVKFFTGGVQDYVPIKNKRLLISKNLCKGCGMCIEACHNDAMTMDGDRAKVDHDKCLLCGYCSADCPELAIRLI